MGIHRNWSLQVWCVVSWVGAAILSPGSALATEGRYIAGGLAQWEFNGDAFSSPSKPHPGIIFKVGAQKDSIGLDLEVMSGGTNSGYVLNIPVDIKMNYCLSGFLRYILTVDRLHIHGSGGYSSSSFDVTTISSVGSTARGWSFGGGIEFDVLKNWSLAAEYNRYLHDSSFAFTSLNYFLKYYY